LIGIANLRYGRATDELSSRLAAPNEIFSEMGLSGMVTFARNHELIVPAATASDNQGENYPRGHGVFRHVSKRAQLCSGVQRTI